VLPELQQDGNLPPGLHECTLSELEQAFGIGERRSEHCRKLKSIVERAIKCGFKGVIVMGSFVSAKPEPPDFDLIWVLPRGLVTQDLSHACRQLLDANRSPDLFGCDVFSCPEEQEVMDRYAGPFMFGFDKYSGKPRGLVIMHLSQ
jgi:hypothetical protein